VRARRRRAAARNCPTCRGWTRCAGSLPSCSRATPVSMCSPQRVRAVHLSRHVTPDGFEQTFALNHLAPFLLTNLPLKRLTASRGRVVTPASDSHKDGRLDLDDVQSERGRFRPGRGYGHEQALKHPLRTRASAPQPNERRQLLPPRHNPHRLRQERRRAGASQPHAGRAVPALAGERCQLAPLARARPSSWRSARPIRRKPAPGAPERAGAG
jgi:hypothetical protein